MQALFLVLHKIEKLDDLLIALQNNGITGGTIIDSKGMINTLRNNDNFIIESLRIFLEDPREASKTLFFILKKDDVLNARKIIDETLGGINNPNTGILFGIDLAFVDGLKI
ncbi:hypothetical protein [Thomasclavelia cocleata]|jgi:hypothetical protein|uniref:Nitrogen regulatory protein P-II family n=1 Tax=Thomasclavelia cocleata TaxID=69824 RepID=A0A1I0FYT9_9FIRM|nr:hypothetical protein [Thomasclavelia cocleata]MCI9130681.1 hypothetical protein [Thomasclavelia cocleata]MCI9629879.1 hypothetical protein [Thomasclavelia cocleata]MCR1961480.1 hypothetical protein [Thomasclavelia cocleata]NDO42309.1 hypothetical protein [Thomasclavelia cocleata]PJN80242.1 hypothetical protein CWE04_09450 [Thomasclavelia cocleata]